MNARVAIMNGSLVTLAILGIVSLAGVWQNVRFVQERGVLRSELAALRDEPLPETAREDAKVIAEISRLSRELSQEAADLKTADAHLVTLQRNVPPMEDQQLRSFGRIEQMGREASEFLPQLADFMKKMREGFADSVSEDELARAIGKMMGWSNRIEAIGELEAHPDEIARFHAAGLQARLQLDPVMTENVRVQVEREYAHLNEQGLARPQRPDEDQDEWYRRRKEALDAVTTHIEALIPAGQHQPFAVGQSLHLGTGMRTWTQTGTDGHGSIIMGLVLPGIE